MQRYHMKVADRLAMSMRGITLLQIAIRRSEQAVDKRYYPSDYIFGFNDDIAEPPYELLRKPHSQGAYPTPDLDDINHTRFHYMILQLNPKYDNDCDKKAVTIMRD